MSPRQSPARRGGQDESSRQPARCRRLRLGEGPLVVTSHTGERVGRESRVAISDRRETSHSSGPGQVVEQN